MKSVKELLKENRKDKFVPIADKSSSLTADLEDSFIRELLNDALENSIETENHFIEE